MEGFKSFKKIQCFKEGGSVQKEVHNFTKRDRKSVDVADTKQDKAIVKKAFAMHDKQEHDGEKTDLSKLKKGGRAKKEVGTVKKYKTGGTVNNVYEAKKKAGDLDNIKKVKDTKAVKLCGGKSVRKMADGGGVLDTLKNNIMGTPEQNAMASQKEQAYLKAKMAQKAAGANLGPAEEMAVKLAGAGQKLQPAPVARKKGGKIKKYAEGGSIDDDVRSRAMKWIESGSPEQTASAPSAPVAKKKSAAKSYKPDYSNEEAERMGLNEKDAIPLVSDEEVKRESQGLRNRKPAPKFSVTRAVGVRDVPKVPDYAKEATGYKRGGKAKK